jgi:hypothetical protein
MGCDPVRQRLWLAYPVIGIVPAICELDFRAETEDSGLPGMACSISKSSRAFGQPSVPRHLPPVPVRRPAEVTVPPPHHTDCNLDLLPPIYEPLGLFGSILVHSAQ